MRGGAFLKGKEGRVGFRKKVRRDGVILEKAALRAVTSFSFREGFLSLVRGTEGVVKT